MITLDEFKLLVKTEIGSDLIDNPAQNSRIEHNDDNILMIVAGPGSGKTRILVLRALKNNKTDILPHPGSKDEQLIRMWRSGESTDQLSMGFRLQRAIRVIPITDTSKNRSLGEFDNAVKAVEEDIIKEIKKGNILTAWAPDCKDAATCIACDFRHFCPNRADKDKNYKIKRPSLEAFK